MKDSDNTLAIFCLFVLVLIFGGLISSARGQDHSGHAQFHEEFYSKWKQPGSEASCCNARKVFDTNGGTMIVGDCEPTEAEIRNGEWWARLPSIYHHHGDLRGYIKVPDHKIIREKNPTQGGVDGHLCWTPSSGVLCFVPPFGGG